MESEKKQTAAFHTLQKQAKDKWMKTICPEKVCLFLHFFFYNILKQTTTFAHTKT